MSFTGASILQETQISGVTNRVTTLEGRAQAIENTAVLQRSDFATHVAAKNVKDTEQDDRLTILENATSNANTDFESYVESNDSKNVEQDGRLVAVETKAETSKQSFETYVASNGSTVTSLTATVTANKSAFDTYVTANDTLNTTQNTRLDSAESRLDAIDTNIVGRVDDAINSKVATTTFDLLAAELRDVDSDLSTALATKVASTVQVATDAAQDAKIDARVLQTAYDTYTAEDIKINKLNEIKIAAMEQFIRAFLSTYNITNPLDQVYAYKGYAQKEFEIAPATLSFVSRLNDNTRIHIKALEYATRSNSNQIRIYSASQFELLAATVPTESKTVSASLGDITQIYTMTRAVTPEDFPIKLTYQDTNGNVICEQSLTYVQYQALPNNNVQVPSAPTNLVATAGDSQVSISYTPGSDNGAAITNYKYSIDNGVTWIAFSPALTGSAVTITGLTNETTYSIKLRAVNSVGDGVVSSSVSVTLIALPSWVQRGADINGEAVQNWSGYSVSTSADGLTVAIGAILNGESNSGHVRVYTWNSTTSVWVQRGADINGEAAGDLSGYSVSLSADGLIVAIGAIQNDGNGSNSGHVRVYTWNSTTSVWVQRGADINGEAAGDYSGSSVSLSADGSVVAIGAVYNDGNGNASGHVRVYTWNSTTSVWVQRGADINGETVNDESGQSVSLSADGLTVAIGANLNGGNGSNSGHVRVYTWNSTTNAWVQRGADIDGEAAGDESGFSVSLSADGSVVAIGAIYNDGNGTDSGHVRVYTWNSTTSTWVKRGADIDGEAAWGQSGYSVSLSADGSVVAIGANLNDGNGNDSGHVRVYTWNSTTNAWVQRGADINGEAVYDQSGYSVSLSADGSVVAIGAIYNDGNGTDSGHVRVYSFQ